MTSITRTIVLPLFTLVLLSPGCSGCFAGGATNGEAATIEFALLTGDGCARGCSLEAPLLVGTEEVIDLVSDVALSDAYARSSDPRVLAAFLDDVTLCCGEVRCSAVLASQECALDAMPARRLVVRALRPGVARVEIRAGNVVVDQLALRVAAAVDVVATRVILPVDEASADMRGEGPSPDVRVAAPAPAVMDGSVDEVFVRRGEAVYLRLEAFDAAGRRLVASRGVGAVVSDPDRALLRSPGSNGVPLPGVTGDVVEVIPVSEGRTHLTLGAGRATRSVDLCVMPEGIAPEAPSPALPSEVVVDRSPHLYPRLGLTVPGYELRGPVRPVRALPVAPPRPDLSGRPVMPHR